VSDAEIQRRLSAKRDCDRHRRRRRAETDEQAAARRSVERVDHRRVAKRRSRLRSGINRY